MNRNCSDSQKQLIEQKASAGQDYINGIIRT